MQKILLILLSIFILSACQNDGQKAFIREEGQIEIYRYDRLQYEASLSNSVAAIQKMNIESPRATKILIEDVLGLGSVNSPNINERVRDYYKDTVLTQVMMDVREQFKDLSDLEVQFTKAQKFQVHQWEDRKNSLCPTEYRCYIKEGHHQYATAGAGTLSRIILRQPDNSPFWLHFTQRPYSVGSYHTRFPRESKG